MDKLFLGISSHVVCLSKKTGQEIWKTKLRTSTIINVYYEDRQVYAHAGGHLFCLSAKNGKVIWENPLKGLGYGICLLASENQTASAASSQVASQQSIVASTVMTTDNQSSGD